MTYTLSDKTKELLGRSDEERMQYISRNIWIDYPIAENIIKKMDNLIRYEKGKSRITSILLVGSSTNGKTSLLEQFIALHPPYDYNIEGGRPDWVKDDFFDNHSGIGLPVLYITAPNEPSESRLYTNILNELNAPFKERDTISRKQYLVEYYLNIFNVEMIIIDEIHGILNGSTARQRQTMDAIKILSNRLKIPIILSGIKDALRAVSTNTQISSRFRPEYLPKWKMNQEYVNLLATLVSMLPLHKESTILTPKAAEEILVLSQGYIGEIVDIIKSAALYAITSESERITLKEIYECDHTTLGDVDKDADLQDV